MAEVKIAQCSLKKTSRMYIWVVSECPYCGKRHEHGGGPVEGDPRKFLGPRESHCELGATGGQYLLQEKLT